MTNESTTETTPTTTNDPSNPNLSFSEYEKVRRGGEVAPSANKSAPGSEKVSEQKKTPPESDAEETEVEDGAGEESDSEEDLDASADLEKEKPKKKSGFQRRIDKLNAAKTAAQQETEYWKSQALKGAEESKAQSKVDAKPVAAEGKPDPENFETHAAYVEALTDWKTEQKLNERDQRLEKSKLEIEQEKAVKAHASRVKAFAGKTKDFQDVIDAVDDIPAPPALRELIVSSDNGPELMYELAKNREEFARICSLSPLALAREIGKIDAKISATTSETSEEPIKLTKAPKPIAPVGGSKGVNKRSVDDPDISFSEYESRRREQMKRR